MLVIEVSTALSESLEWTEADHRRHSKPTELRDHKDATTWSKNRLGIGWLSRNSAFHCVADAAQQIIVLSFASLGGSIQVQVPSWDR